METLLHVGLSNAAIAAGMAVAVTILGAFLRRPALLHGLWLLVLVKLVTPPLVLIPIAWPSVAEPRPEPGPTSEFVVELVPEVWVALDEPEAVWLLDVPDLVWDEVEPWILLDDESLGPSMAAPDETTPVALTTSIDWTQLAGINWTRLVGAIWLAGSLGCLALAVGRVRRFQRLLREAIPAPKPLNERVWKLSAVLGLRRPPGVWLVPGPVSPMIWAPGTLPKLLVPVALWDELADDQRDALLVHELAHLKRGDHWVRALELVVTVLHWWNPVAWWARRSLREAEEQCCDAWVVWALPDSARAYATALLTTLDFLSDAPSPVPVAASGIGHLSCLKRRLTMIVRGTTPKGLSLAGRLGVLGLAAVLLPWLPTSAQQAETTEAEEPPQAVETADEEELFDIVIELDDSIDALKDIDIELIPEIRELRERLGREAEEIRARLRELPELHELRGRLEKEGEEIRVDDQFHSVILQRGDSGRFALIDKIDMNRDGRDDREDLIRLIETNGGIIEYDLPPPGVGEGEQGELNFRIAWYVIDDQPPFRDPGATEQQESDEETAQFLEKRAEAIRKAQELGIRPMSLQRLLPYLGYRSDMRMSGWVEAEVNADLREKVERIAQAADAVRGLAEQKVRALEQDLESARAAVRANTIQRNRVRQLFEEGLETRRAYELAKERHLESQERLKQVEAALEALKAALHHDRDAGDTGIDTEVRALIEGEVEALQRAAEQMLERAQQPARNQRERAALLRAYQQLRARERDVAALRHAEEDARAEAEAEADEAEADEASPEQAEAIAKARAEVREAQRRLQQAVERLAELEGRDRRPGQIILRRVPVPGEAGERDIIIEGSLGRGRGRGPFPLEGRISVMPEVRTRTRLVEPAAPPEVPQPPAPPEAPEPPVPEAAIPAEPGPEAPAATTPRPPRPIRPGPGPGPMGPMRMRMMPLPRDQERRISELEQKIDRLLEAVEKLQQERDDD